jgi:hypothetical protein
LVSHIKGKALTEGFWVLRRIFGPKKEEQTGKWKKLHNGELHNVYSSPKYIIMQIKSRRMTWAGHVAHVGEEKKVHKILVGEHRGKTPLGRPRHRWENRIKRNLRRLAGRMWS